MARFGTEPKNTNFKTNTAQKLLGEIMHEWALAESVIANLEKSREKELKVVLGELQNVDVPIFRHAIEELAKQKTKKKLHVEVEKAEFKCKNCSALWTLADTKISAEEKESIHFIPEMAHAFIKCPNCRSSDFRITKGRGIKIESYSDNKKKA
ncbi:MAG: hydrogenase nickel incorporation protein HypA [Candidatus Woesearchaeota archaeon]